ncbi:hypothetical protein [Alkaliphilus serpentinus]|uniref:MerR family transcriptional regulator n=1 Tax=Alkaliphilus serpentinus TaxID=1482731 RepID=A0A833HLU5_9FIRM|nr:hypothetical protein [Alkaliphilus serpentinus]KAB3526629.1 hypothetical protein F8153_13580 [Alkaliphilus serpentinus]
MKLINCTICGRLFKSQYFTICEDCLEGQEEVNPYKKVKDFLEKHPGANALEVSNATGVPKNLIVKFINDDVISVVKKRS